MKLANLAYYDSELIARNVKGMSNASKLDREIVEEFNGDWEELTYQAQLILSKFKHTDIKTLNPDLYIEDIPEGIDVEKETKVRVGQSFFRLSVLAAYGNSCCITGLGKPELLIDSHIKPWKDCNEKTKRTNPSNGLCFNALHDRAFDKGLITLDKNYHMVISKRLDGIGMDENTHDWFYFYAN